MTSPRTITLFTESTDLGQRPIAFVASILVHGLGLAVVLFGFAYKPPIARVTTEFFASRRLDLLMPLPQNLAGAKHTRNPRPHPAVPRPPSAAKPLPRPPALRLTAQIKHGPQTLIQPDLETHDTLAEKIPLPQVVLWSPPERPVKNIVPPLPQKPATADVKPALDRPTPELNLADINLASSNYPSPKLPVVASTASPLAVHLPQQGQSPLASAAQASAQPTPATVLSPSDLLMNGAAILPAVNEAEDSSTPGLLALGAAGNPSPPGNGNSNANGGGAAGGSNTGQGGPGAGSGTNPYGEPAATEITLPENGRFSAVVVGDALEDEFPEVAGVWRGRIAYTVYLHVGLQQNWILQYSLPPSADAAAAGTIARLDAPWPYNIVRPNIAPASVDADALVIHGFLNPSGRFEALSLAFPQSFPQAQFILGALQLWQFRPAMQNGQPATVEILLIIPLTME